MQPENGLLQILNGASSSVARFEPRTVAAKTLCHIHIEPAAGDTVALKTRLTDDNAWATERLFTDVATVEMHAVNQIKLERIEGTGASKGWLDAHGRKWSVA